MNKFTGLLIVCLLAACNSDGEDSASGVGIVVTGPADGAVKNDPVTGGGTTGDNPFPWNRYFVTEFDQAEVQKIRDLRGFLANNFTFRLGISGHPTYGGAGRNVQSNPLSAARLDYALSTGLSGAGQIVSVIDDGIRLSHEQFDGKTFYSSGGAPESGDFHGTAVASVIAGNGVAGGTLGFAPAADLHQGYLNYKAAVDWDLLGSHMRDAAEVGAIASNNSWGLANVTVADLDVGSYFQNWQRKPYIDGLLEFAADGVIVFALQNDYTATSASLMAALPLGIPSLEANWISVINALPTFDDDRILSAERISAPCLETAKFCMAANGQIMVATQEDDDTYRVGVGASFAAPQVAGSIALLAEAFPDLTAAQLRDRLLATADNSFFDQYSGTVTFAPGITHGYNTEFGHGFLDLRASLLPIGQAVVMTPDGQSLDLGSSAIMSSAATGDALSRSLAALTVVSNDQLYGSFTLSADVLAGTGARIDPAATALMVAIRPDVAAARASLNTAILSGGSLAGHRGAWADPSGAELLGSTVIPLTSPDDSVGVSVLTGNGTTGLSLHQTFDLRGGNVQLGFATMQTEGSVMGVSVPSSTGEIRSTTNAIHIDFASRLSPDTALRFNAEMGLASGDGAGMVRDFSTMAYDRIGVAVERADIGRSGDVLAVFARQPVGITRGSANMDLPVQFANGQTSFATQSVDLAPTERQLDLGFEYTMPFSQNGNLSLGMMHSQNDGNIAGQKALSGFVGVQFRL